MDCPIKCFTCGNVLADKYTYYLKEIRRRKLAKGLDPEAVVYLTGDTDSVQKTSEEEVMNELGLVLQCCRRVVLTHKSIE